jgi:UDP-glucose 4-epimerase
VPSGAGTNPADLLDLVALGTVADVVPLDFNNRVLVSQGLRRIRAGRCTPGLQALLEVAARHTDLQTVIVRPPLVHGPGVKGNMLRLMGLVRRGLPLPFGRVVNRRSLVGVQNLVDLLVACVGHPRAAGEVLLLRDDQEVSTPELLRMIGFAMDTKDRVFDLPIGLMTLVGRATGRQRELERLFGSLMVDDAHTRSLLAWRPKRSLEDGVKEMVRWYLHENNQGG